MADLKNLEPEDRCRVLVGMFLQAWATMELALRDTIGAALNVDSIQVQILSANTRFRDKVDIMRTLVDVSSLPTEEKQLTKRRLFKLGKHAPRRNMIAHVPFLPDGKTGGVRFLTTKARGEYDKAVEVWSPQRFAQEHRALAGYTQFLGSLAGSFRRKPLVLRDYVHTLRPFLYMDTDFSNFPPA